MKAIRLHDYGLSDALHYEEIPVPVIKENQVLVKVYATSVNHLDLKKGSGAFRENMELEFPWIPGHDFAGTIENPGIHEDLFQKGDKVYGNCMGGSFAEFVAVDIDKVVKKPANLTFIEAASVPHVGETAWQALYTHGQLKKGEKILIHGAAGAVGAYAVQFARITGAEIYATASGQDCEFLACLGADVVIDYKTTDFTTVAKDMDVVLVLVGGDTQKRSYPIMNRGGRLVSTTGPILKDQTNKYDVKGISMVIEQSGADLEKITELINEDKVKTDIAVTYSLPDAAEAWKLLGGEDPGMPKMSHGKIVLEVIKEFDTAPVE